MTEKWLNNVKEATPGAAGERGHSYSLSKVPSSYSMSKMHILLHVQDILLLLLLLLFLAIAGTKHMINPEKTPKEILVSGLFVILSPKTTFAHAVFIFKYFMLSANNTQKCLLCQLSSTLSAWQNFRERFLLFFRQNFPGWRIFLSFL